MAFLLRLFVCAAVIGHIEGLRQIRVRIWGVQTPVLQTDGYRFAIVAARARHLCFISSWRWCR
jgi:hypothetical protein